MVAMARPFALWHSLFVCTTALTAFDSDILECLEKDDCPDSMRLLQKRSETTPKDVAAIANTATDTANQRIQRTESSAESSAESSTKNSAESSGCQEIVDLSGQRLTTWPWDATDCQSLQILDLSNNFLEDVPKYAFSNTPNLRILRLNMNRITSFPAVTSLNKLWELDLSFNSIEILPKGALTENRQLTTLNLRHNKLTHLPSFDYWLGQQNELNVLILANNQITSIDASTAGGTDILDSLDWLDVSGNKLSYLGADFAKDVKGVDNLVLTGNPFSCRGIDVNCNTKWAVEDQSRLALPVNWCSLPACYPNLIKNNEGHMNDSFSWEKPAVAVA